MQLHKCQNLCASIDQILNMARKTAKENAEPVWVFVPDRFTLEAERILLRTTSCLLNVRVITFSMLFNLVSGEQNFKPQTLDKTKAVLFMWNAINDVAGELQWFRDTPHYSFAEKMFNTVNQLQSSMVDFDRLEKNAKADITRKKMHDISVIYKRYRGLTAAYTDTGGVLNYLIQHIKSSKQVREVAIFMCGFEHLSIQRLAVVEELLRFAKEFVIGVRENSELEAQLAEVCL